MRTSILILSMGLVLSWSAPAQAQKGKSPADVLPASTIIYAETQQLGQLAKEVHELFKGSVLYNLPESLDPLKEKYKPLHGPDREFLAGLGMALSPEVISELGRVEGSAIAWVGSTNELKIPTIQWVAIIKPGTSNVPTFLTKLAFNMSPGLKVKEKVEGVAIYRTQQKIYKFGPVFPPDQVQPGQPPQPPQHEYRETDPSMALMPGYIFIGSHQAVKDCILRAKGKGNGPSLAENKDFQEANKKIGGEPGIFAHLNYPALMQTLTESIGAGPQPADAIAMLDSMNKLINFKAFRSIAYGLSLKKGDLSFQQLTLLDPKEKSPVLDLYPTKPFNPELLHFAPKDAILAMGFSNHDGEQRWNKLLAVLDEALPAQALGGNKVSEHLKNVEQNLGVNVGKDICDRITNLAFVVGDPLTAPVKVTTVQRPNFMSTSYEPQVPMVLILEATDGKAARDLVDLMPKLGKLVTNLEVQPDTKQIKGQDVFSLRLTRDYSLNYGIVGKTVVIGPYAESVGQALADGAARKGLLADARTAAQVKEFKDSPSVSLAKPMGLIGGLVTISFKGTSTVTSDPGFKVQPGQPIPPPPPPPPPKITVTIREDDPATARQKKQLKEILAEEPFLVIGVTTGEGFFLSQGKAAGLNQVVPKLIDFGVEEAFKMNTYAGGGHKHEHFPPGIPDFDPATPPPGIAPMPPRVPRPGVKQDEPKSEKDVPGR